MTSKALSFHHSLVDIVGGFTGKGDDNALTPSRDPDRVQLGGTGSLEGDIAAINRAMRMTG